MDDTFPADVAPLWAWGVTGGSAVLALLSHLLGGSAIELFTGVAVGVTLVGGVYILYSWGQRREQPADEDDESSQAEREREREMMAEAGGYGGNGGGV